MHVSPADERPAPGLFLDLDGTLADSISSLKGVFARFMASLGEPADDAAFDALNGVKLSVALQTFRHWPDYGLSGDDAVARYDRFIADAYEDVVAHAGAGELLESATSLGWRVAVVTSADRAHATRWLSRQGLRDHVDLIVGGDDVANGKPAPDPYLLALKMLNGDRAASLAVEDSPTGARSATSAEVSTVVVHAGSAERPLFPDGVRFLADLREVAADLRRLEEPA